MAQRCCLHPTLINKPVNLGALDLKTGHSQARELTAVPSGAFSRPWESLQASPNTSLVRQQILVMTELPEKIRSTHAQALASSNVPVAYANFRLNDAAAAISTGGEDSRLQAPASCHVLAASANFCPEAHSAAATLTGGEKLPLQAPASTNVLADSANVCSKPHAATVISTDGKNTRLQAPASKTTPAKSLNFSRLHHLTASQRHLNRDNVLQLPASEQRRQVGVLGRVQPPRVLCAMPLIQAKDQKSDATETMDRILTYVSSLQKQVESCVASSRNELEYVVPKEALNEVLLELGNLHVRGNDKARKRRNRLTDKVNKIVNLLDSKVPPLGQQLQRSDHMLSEHVSLIYRGKECEVRPNCSAESADMLGSPLGQSQSQSSSSHSREAKTPRERSTGMRVPELTIGETQSTGEGKSNSPAQEKRSVPNIIEKMKLYERQVNALKEQVTLCEATSRQQIEYIFLDEMLTRKLMDLDNVVVEDDESVRQIRKRLVSSLQESINLLESKVPPMEEQTQSARERRKRESTQNENLGEHKKSSEEPLPQTSDQNNVDRRSQLQQT
ncbi:hypothetical protein QAD02_020809 [Eretmocerus hayati]|uniref:Uncharacterized protein n=1 Tax=Eretmocerus hayati TaxID=131215 RepID=A0ACC2PQD0_9HYME|nr:hypothetical protein QAD02_020809 [Eretmocerus hayati]